MIGLLLLIIVLSLIAANWKSKREVPGPFQLPLLGNLLTFALATPKSGDYIEAFAKSSLTEALKRECESGTEVNFLHEFRKLFTRMTVILACGREVNDFELEELIRTYDIDTALSYQPDLADFFEKYNTISVDVERCIIVSTVDIIGATLDTTAVSLSFFILACVNYPEWQELAASDIQREFPGESESKLRLNLPKFARRTCALSCENL